MTPTDRQRTHARFVGAPVEPEPGSFDAASMARGQPGLPRRFAWDGRTWEVDEVIAQWKTTGDCTHGSGEQYVRRHWFDIRTTDGTRMTLYADRRPRKGKPARQRWWLFETSEA